MEFGKKLDFLMNITKTTNSSLAHYISMDASYISRLRNGKRTLPKEASFPKTMARYFVRKWHDDQHQAFLDGLSKSNLISERNIKDSEELLYSWLVDENYNLDDMEEYFNEKLFLKANNGKCEIDCINNHEFSIFYGIDGKREAVLLFLESVINAKTPQTLYLSSDEGMDWLGDDVGFFNKWRGLMGQVILQGNRIRIIHSVNRDLDEMLIAIKGWMPLYMTGSIEAYYYPKKRDGVFKRTLFIAPKTGAIISTSVGNMEDIVPCTLISDKRAIEGYKREFDNYLSLCKPLVKAFTKDNSDEYKELLDMFIWADGSQVIKETKDYIAYMKEDKGVIVGDTTKAVAIFISEGNITAAFGDYFNHEREINSCCTEKNILLDRLRNIFKSP